MVKKKDLVANFISASRNNFDLIHFDHFQLDDLSPTNVVMNPFKNARSFWRASKAIEQHIGSWATVVLHPHFNTLFYIFQEPLSTHGAVSEIETSNNNKKWASTKWERNFSTFLVEKKSLNRKMCSGSVICASIAFFPKLCLFHLRSIQRHYAIETAKFFKFKIGMNDERFRLKFNGRVEKIEPNKWQIKIKKDIQLEWNLREKKVLAFIICVA